MMRSPEAVTRAPFFASVSQIPWVRFALVGLAFYAVWFVVYDLWLLPQGSLDAALSHGVARTSGFLAGLVGLPAEVAGRVVRLEGSEGVYIEDGCNGLSTLGLFVGFVIAYPGAWRRRWVYLAFGVATVLVANVLRVVGLVALQAYWPSAFDAVHTFGATTFFYVVVFGLWVGWAHYGGGPGTNERPARP